MASKRFFRLETWRCFILRPASPNLVSIPEDGDDDYDGGRDDGVDWGWW